MQTDIINPDAVPDITIRVPNKGSSNLHNSFPGKLTLGFQYEALKGGPSVMKTPGLNANLSGQRGVKLCSEPINTVKTLRPPAIPNANSYQVKQGFARGQKEGLAYDKHHPLNSKLLVPADNFSSAMKSNIKYPK